MKISVIVPAYNVESYLKQCLDSIVGQAFSNLEIILVNDGSTDGSGRICDEFAVKDSRIKVIHQENAGASSARNSGIEVATGDYLTFVDSDDWLDTEMYRKMTEAAKSSRSADVIMCDFLNVKPDKIEKISADLRKGYYEKQDIIKEIYPKLIMIENFGRVPIASACICLFKNSLFKENSIRFDKKLKYSEDNLFMTEIILKADSFLYLKDEYFYHYRQYDTSRSKKYNDKWWSNFLYLSQNLEKLVFGNPDFDFSRQIKLQLIHSALFLSNAIFENNTISVKNKIKLLSELFYDKTLNSAFSGLNFNHQSLAIKIVLNMIKFRLPRTYFGYRSLVSILKYKLKVQ